MISYGFSGSISSSLSSFRENGSSLRKAALPARLSVIFFLSLNWLEPVSINFPGVNAVLSTWSFNASKISGTFCASSIMAPSGKAITKSAGLELASSRIFLSSKVTYFLSGKVSFVRVDLPLCLGPVMPTIGNCSAIRSKAF